jgi:hypothetical protein
VPSQTDMAVTDQHLPPQTLSLPLDLQPPHLPQPVPIDPELLQISMPNPYLSGPSTIPRSGGGDPRSLAMPLPPAWSKEYHLASKTMKVAANVKITRQQIDETCKKLCDIVLYHSVGGHQIVHHVDSYKLAVEWRSAHHSRT